MQKKLVPAAGLALAVAGFSGLSALPAVAAPSAGPLSGTSATAPQSVPATADIEVLESEISAEDFVDESKGATIVANGYEPGADVSLSLAFNGQEGVYEDTQAADENGAVAFSVYGLNAEDPEAYIGEYVATVTGPAGPDEENPGEDLTQSVNFSVVESTEDDDDSEAPSEVTVSTEQAEYTAEELATDGVTVEIEGFTEDQDIDVRFFDGDDEITESFENVGGGGDTGYSASTYTAEVPEGFTGPITVSVDVLDEDDNVIDTVTTTFEVVEATDDDETEAPAERALTVEPEEISAADFVDEEQGVAITASGFTEGEVVTLTVVAGPENVEGVELTETANEEGVAAFSVYGVNASQPEVYIGDYDLEVVGADDEAEGEDPLTGSFSVVAETGDDNGNGGGGGGGDLPRTGAELTGLGAGLALLVAGVGTVLLTTRRAKKANGPADI